MRVLDSAGNRSRWIAGLQRLSPQAAHESGGTGRRQFLRPKSRIPESRVCATLASQIRPGERPTEMVINLLNASLTEVAEHELG